MAQRPGGVPDPRTAGLFLVTATVFFMAFLGGGASAFMVAFVLTFYGVGAGLFQSPNNSDVLGAAPRERLGTASGITVASTVWAMREQAYLSGGMADVAAQAAGFRDAFLVLGFAGLVAIIASVPRGGKRPMASQVEVPPETAVPAKRQA